MRPRADVRRDERVPLRDALRALGRVDPPEGLAARIAVRLDDSADRRAERVAPAARRPPRWVLPGALALAAAALWASGGTLPGGVERLEIELRDGAHAWLPLPVDAAHHAGGDATIDVTLPTGLAVEPPSFVTLAGPPRCDEDRCVHSFLRPAGAPDAVELRVAVAAPGRYAIHVDHRSSTRRVSRRYLVDAYHGAGVGSRNGTLTRAKPERR